MKVCPTCQSSNYPDGFKYCPQCNSSLMSNDDYQRSMNAAMVPNPTEEVTTLEAFSREVVSEPIAPKVEPKIEPVPTYVAPRNIEFNASVPAAPAPPPAPPKVEKPVAVPVAASVPAPPVAPKEIPATSATTKAAAPNSYAMVPGGSELKFSMPDSGTLLSRLISNLKNIQDVKFGAKRVAAGTTDNFQVLLADESLVSRVSREVGQVVTELRADPKKFASDFIRGEGTNLRRRNALLAGSELAIVGYATLYICLMAATAMGKAKGTLFNAIAIGLVTYLVACFAVRGFLLNRIVSRFTSFITIPKLSLEFANWVPVVALLAFIFTSDRWFCQVFPKQCGIMDVDKSEYTLLTSLTNEKPPEVAKAKPKEEVVVKGKGGLMGGSKPKPEAAHGGGGNVDPTPVTKGVPPQMTMAPIVMPPSKRTPTVTNPSLVQPMLTKGDDALSKQMAGRIGMENGVDAALPSLGNGGGRGLGGGQGEGQGPGRGGNKGGGDMSTGGGGRGNGNGDEIVNATGSVKPNFLHTEKARYTEQARTNRVQGTVVVSAVFTADGRITSIRVTRGLPDGLDEEAIKALHKFRFTPAMKNGQPVSARMSLEFTFSLL